MSGAQAVTAAAPPTSGPKIASYLRLGKARVYHYVYGWALGVLLLHADDLTAPGVLPSLVCVLAGTLAVQWSASAADDVSGFLNGHDARNYQGRPLVTRIRKPLLTGALTVREAKTFTAATFTFGMLALTAAALLPPGPVSWPAVVVALGVPVLGVQYSCGIKLSYRPLGLEATILITGAYTVLMPYWCASGTLTREVLLVSAVFGLWLLLVVSYGNASDRVGDAAVRRRTLAVLLPPRWFAFLLHLLVVGHAGLLVVLFAATRMDPAYLVCSAPVVALQLAQVYYGVYRGEVRKARFLVLLSIDAGTAALAAAILLGLSQ
ncbi:UbiA family prenyltransferase [Streptomyces sp. NBC_01283]|uniref:UbiA family prenyltransferase n=1 Tax=Streptomyces sp. NBC_01283 TaxID=2903812 RepID=UPI00352E1E66|nr:UbiA family prenyltransferase [Streptomyces sp. NBC_01283]